MIRQRSGVGIKQVHCFCKDDIIQEASVLFETSLSDNVLAYQDGSEVPDNFHLITHMKDNNIVYPSRAKACHRLYLINSFEKKGILMQYICKLLLISILCTAITATDKACY